jgi:photosystem II stability/assembly factor-like uncharacterized protein
MKKLFSALSIFSVLGIFTEGYAQAKVATTTMATTPNAKQDLVKNLKWRNIGPFRGGRSIAVAGHADQPLTFYFGATGGGVWKTLDGGNKWLPISDSTFKTSSVGALSVANSDPNVIYAGMGETDIRGNIAGGDGIYKSTDAGKSWKHMGLKKSWGIARIVVHPKNADMVYVASLGNPFGRVPNKSTSAEERGIYRSNDGGTTWQQILAPTNDKTGAIEIHMDPNNPSILYAALWECFRNNYSMSSGGDGSGIYKSMDGGNTWKNISKNPGLPVGTLGKMGIAVSHFNSNRVWAIVENKNGGLFRSDDSGENWTRVNNDKNLWQRPWYYCEIEADPGNHDGLYVLNVGFQYTNDGGKSFKGIRPGHGDCHDLWINPKQPNTFILGDDGGAEVTYNQGSTFSDIDLPTSQFYHISLDNEFPYNVYGAQQDNSSVRISSRNTGSFSINRQDWEVATGGESGYVVADPLNNDIIYGGNYMGQIDKLNRKTGERQDVSPNPVQYLGDAAAAMKYRFQWTFPIVFSPHDPKVLYACSQFVHMSTDGAQSWSIISPDLSRNDSATVQSSGGPITKDNTGAETFADIFTFAESFVQKGLFWAGTDDGLMQISKDGGKNWTKCTIAGLPDWSLMSIVEPSHFDAGTAYLAATRYKLDDTKPYLFKTKDFGKTWVKITDGIPENAFTRVIREDPNKKGLLYCGTEYGVFVSFNEGGNWIPLNNNLPITPIHDLQIHKREKDLCVATHGRSFWIMDNLEPLHQMMDEPAIANKNAHLFAPESSYRTGGGAFPNAIEAQQGENAPNGVLVNYFLKEKPKDEVLLKFIGERGDTIITYSSVKDKKGKALEINKDFYQRDKIERPGIASAEAGMNSFVWDTRYQDATDTEGSPAMMWSGSVMGPKVPPGKYQVELVVGNQTIGKQSFEVKKDPRVAATVEDLSENTRFQLRVRDKLSEAHKAVNDLRTIRKQMTDYMGSIQDTVFKKELEKVSKPMLADMQTVEDELIQHKAKAFQDLLAVPIKLNDKLAGLNSVASSAETKPNKQVQEAYEDLSKATDGYVQKLRKVINEDVPKFNQKAETYKTAVIKLKETPIKP